MTPRKIRRNCLAHISGGAKVYGVAIIDHEDGVTWHMLEADAKHPDAAKRVPDAFRWYKDEELRPAEAGA
ncbi:hypothetical protein [Mycobacteroides abscessus]|uniref:hypothetical protein n=1 Tax=Mycobacteroides abscessus TaxID=36809 RepID=UPI0005E32503|nr:hypothetical protein [Mycobacteroides abscessus]CPW71702.1 Uncharacterised protein [Mycobacteroides abscessus]SKF62129.1 Uncharacterised protein [Mycobacteroides abscessus subsp. bolletii]SKH91536.1 Uncharacterised protein [Mycobacteroides abscessus subsp. bolletii]